jgi:hypothetical protein
MTKKAWIENGLVRDVAHADPLTIYHPDIAALYSADVPDDAANGDAWDGEVLTKPTPPAPVEPPVEVVKPPTVGVITYKMLFTSAERIAVKASLDPVIVDLQELMNDPRTTVVDLSLQSISDALDYMTALGLIAPGRKAQILTGELV